MSVGNDDDHSLALYDWSTKALICTAHIDKANVSAILWSSNNEFVSTGVKHIKFWTLNGRNVVDKRG